MDPVLFSLFSVVLGYLIIIYFVRDAVIEYPAANAKKAFCVSCMDLRFVQVTTRFVHALYGHNAVDYYISPGPALSLGKSTGMSSGVEPIQNTLTNALLIDSASVKVDTELYSSFIKARKISKIVNDTEDLLLIEHENCGYYAAVADISNPDSSDLATLKASQIANLLTTKTRLMTDNGSLFARVRCFFVDLNGKFTEY